MVLVVNGRRFPTVSDSLSYKTQQSYGLWEPRLRGVGCQAEQQRPLEALIALNGSTSTSFLASAPLGHGKQTEATNARSQRQRRLSCKPLKPREGEPSLPNKPLLGPMAPNSPCWK